jgi:NAD(P)H-nitrite reductase large subunit
LKSGSFDLLIVGGGVAGALSAIAAKKSRVSTSVALISKETLVYPRASLKFIILGSIKSIDHISLFNLKSLENLKIKVFPNYEAVLVNCADNLLQAKNCLTGDVLLFKYDKLILATGSMPAIPPIKGSNLPGVFTVKWLEDALKLSRFALSGMKAYIIGGSLIALETAEALIKRGLKVTVVARSRILREFFEPDFSKEIANRVEAHGVKILTNAHVDEIGGDKKVSFIKINGEKMEADMVVFATGVKPSTSLAAQMGLQLGESNAIKTDSRMETSLKGIYATGDCAETIDLITGKSVYRPIGSVAAYTAKIAGLNAVGVEETYGGVLRMQYDRIFGNEIAKFGLSTEEAHKLGVACEAVNVDLQNINYPCPLKPSNVLLKALVEKNTDTIIGWQVIGFRQSMWASLFFQETIRNKRCISDIQNIGLRIR